MGKPLRVLIVEDSEDDARLLLRELSRGGFEPACERVEDADAMSGALVGLHGREDGHGRRSAVAQTDGTIWVRSVKGS